MSLTTGNYTITDEFFVTNVHDNNVVLGVQWIISIGCYTTDYQQMEMEFMKDGKKVVLGGMHTYPPKTVTSNKMEAIFRHGDIELAVECRVSKKKSAN